MPQFVPGRLFLHLGEELPLLLLLLLLHLEEKEVEGGARMPTAGTWKVPFKGKFSPYDTEGNRMVPAFSISSRQRNTTVKF